MKKLMFVLALFMSVIASAKMRVDAVVTIKGVEHQETFFLEKKEDAVYVDKSGITLRIALDPHDDNVTVDVRVYRKILGFDFKLGNPIVTTSWGKEIIIECPHKKGKLALTAYPE